MWVLGIYGTAVSGGTLFLPVSLGLSGLWPMIILSLLAFPITFIPYLGLGRYVLAGSTEGGKDGNILDTTIEHLGSTWGKILIALYFATVFPSMTVYTITLTNTIIDFVRTQLGLAEPSRWVVAPIAVFVLMMLVRYGTNTIVKIMGVIVFPFIISIVIFGLLAIPHWNPSMLATAVNFGGAGQLMVDVWKGIPMLVFAFSFTSITSSFVVAQKRHYGHQASRKVTQIMAVAVFLIIATVLFFSWSSILALSPEELAEAKSSNLTIVSFLARKFDTPAMAIASQAIVFAAVIKSFLAHYLATAESAKSFGRFVLGLSEQKLSSPGFSSVLAMFIFWSPLRSPSQILMPSI
nr:aromatic amino acid transport family protein [Advenella mimigardefordensis]